MPSSVRFYEFAAPDKGPSRDGWNRILLDFSARPKPSLFQGIRSMVARNPGELTIWSVFRDGRIQRYASVDATRAESFVRAVRSECGFEALHERDITNVDLPDLLRIREIHLERPDIFPLGMTGAFRALGELSRQHPSETIISLMNLSEAPVDWSSERRVRGLLSEKADDFFAGIRSTRWYTIIRIASRPLVWFWQ
ncbi:MAG TPA: hypothetical protein PK765_01030 [bacterium]|nr:hypothetical protein [bacterium]